MEVEYLKKIMKKCDVYFEDQLISGELLLQSFMDFLADEAGREENNGSIVLHLASPCFDAIAVAWAALTVIRRDACPAFSSYPCRAASVTDTYPFHTVLVRI